jgi:DNA-binding transcriptional MerR regulator
MIFHSLRGNGVLDMTERDVVVFLAEQTGSGSGKTELRQGGRSVTSVAEELGLTIRAIRFYEAEGLIAPERHGIRRRYGGCDVTRLRAIQALRAVGVSIPDIRNILNAGDNPGNEPMQLLRNMLDQRAATLRAEITERETALEQVASLRKTLTMS